MEKCNRIVVDEGAVTQKLNDCNYSNQDLYEFFEIDSL